MAIGFFFHPVLLKLIKLVRVKKRASKPIFRKKKVGVFARMDFGFLYLPALQNLLRVANTMT